jgi:hypothetical protein
MPAVSRICNERIDEYGRIIWKKEWMEIKGYEDLST